MSNRTGVDLNLLHRKGQISEITFVSNVIIALVSKKGILTGDPRAQKPKTGYFSNLQLSSFYRWGNILFIILCLGGNIFGEKKR